MKNILFNQYKFGTKNLKGSIAISIAIGMFIFLFLLIFKPFGIDFSIFEGKVFALSGYGFIASAITFIMIYVVPTYFGRFLKSGWKIINMAIYLFSILFLIAAANLLYTRLLIPETDLSVNNFLYFMIYVYLIGIFPVGFILLSRHISNLKKNIQDLTDINDNIRLKHINAANFRSAETTETESAILIKSDNEKEQLEVLPDNLLCIESEGNYINIHYYKNGAAKTKLLRSSLKTTAANLSGCPGIIQCHRTFIVNLGKVSKVTGNAQGLKLHLETQMIVPVSRTYINKVKSALNDSN